MAAVWMDRPLPVRLADLARSPLAWPLVGFAMLTGDLAGDFELLAANHAGRSFAAGVTVTYPQDVAALRAAATRLEWAEKWTHAVLGHSLPLVVASTGRAPSDLTEADIDLVRDAVRTSPYYTAAVRHSRLCHLPAEPGPVAL